MGAGKSCDVCGISIHALLAESDERLRQKLAEAIISIHALLAESDETFGQAVSTELHFYPRSPCGERPPVRDIIQWEGMNFYPRSPCGERPAWNRFAQRRDFISIHALLAESDDY